MKKVALITGITGQDGSFLSELLLSKGYIVHGLIRRSATGNLSNIEHVKDKIILHYGDLTADMDLINLIHDIAPDEIYNLGAQSDVAISFNTPIYTIESTAVGTAKLLEAIRYLSPKSKLYQAGCHDENTLLVTKNGFKKYNEIKDTDEVYSINPITNAIELKPIKKIIISEYNGEMFNFLSRRMDILVTPNHKMLLRHDNGELIKTNAEDVNSNLRYKNVSQYSLPLPIHNGKDNDYVNIKDMINWADKPINATKNIIEYMNTDDFLYLMGLYIGDGYVQNNKSSKVSGYRKDIQKIRNNERNSIGQFTKVSTLPLITREYKSHYIQYAIPQTDKCRLRLIEVLNRNNISYHLHSKTVEFSSWSLAQLFKECGTNVYEKHIPQWVLEYSTNHLIHLLQGIIDSDGNTRKIVNERSSVSTVSKQLALDISILCYKVQKIPSLTIIKGSIVKFKDNHYCNSHESYQINIAYKKSNKFYSDNILKKIYTGKIWCLEIENNHNFLTIRNGKFAFTGNSTEMFGNTPPPQNEDSVMSPRSPYGASKLMSYHLCNIYRSAYGLFICNGILGNHESERRGFNFVTRKISRAVAMIKANKQRVLELGNLNAKRDWGYSKDYVEVMWAMMQQIRSDNYAIGTGEAHTIKEFLVEAFGYLNMNWEDYVVINQRYYRPAEVNYLCVDASRAKTKLGWTPKTDFKSLVRIMVEHDLKEVSGIKYYTYSEVRG